MPMRLIGLAVQHPFVTSWIVASQRSFEDMDSGSLTLRGAFLMVGALLIAGCGPFTLSTHSTTLSSDGTNAGQVIYRISEETAFTTALDAYAVLLPKQGVDDIVERNRRGYNVEENFGASQWHHRIL